MDGIQQIPIVEHPLGRRPERVVLFADKGLSIADGCLKNGAGYGHWFVTIEKVGHEILTAGRVAHEDECGSA